MAERREPRHPREWPAWQRWLAAAVGIAVFWVGLLLGAVVLSALLVLGFLAGLVLAVRLWWQSRQRSKRGGRPRPGGDGVTIEGDYEVVDRRRDGEGDGR